MYPEKHAFMCLKGKDLKTLKKNTMLSLYWCFQVFYFSGLQFPLFSFTLHLIETNREHFYLEF